ncbi:DUF6415 family natural product biosynthesis protein [Streptomyces sp. NPDC059165]|uniref:DUF6415 family natural product biosynthesis protein n=1 Tax=Streptomyces sp. NPDC059165 TaxID=3346751 RepID=UPI0036C1D1E3
MTEREPLDLTTMRATARRVLESGQPRPQIEDLIDEMRSMVSRLAPEVRLLISRRPSDDVPVRVAQIGVDEAWRRLTTPRGFGPDAVHGQARRLALSVLSLCDHVENLNGSRP